MTGGGDAMKKKTARWFTVLMLLIGLVWTLFLGGCASIGPATVTKDRFDYTTAIADSWKSQMLLNIVKIRYSDTPVFIDVSSVISQVGIENTVNVSAGWSFPPMGNNQSISGSTKFGEKPTITYAPLSGEKFTKSLLTPIPPSGLLFLIQGGWPVRMLLEMCVKSINDLDNRATAPAFARSEDPQFQTLVGLLERMQKSGAVGMRITKKDNRDASVMTFRRKVTPEVAQEMATVRKLLGLNPDADELTVIYGSTSTRDDEIAILTRSIMDIIIEMSSQIDVPAQHVAENRTYATSREIGQGAGQTQPFIRVLTSKEKPEDSFAAIRNRDHWFWVDDGDRASKGRFTFLMVLFSLVETGTVTQAPLVTIPIN
jgi:hypothetical protein